MIRAKTRLNQSLIDGVAIKDLPRPLLVFLHADAIELIASPDSSSVELAGQPGVELAYCTTAWQRRRSGQPTAPARPSSLVQFWAHQLDCWQTARATLHDDEPVLIRLDQAQDDLGWQESLEVILAAATLEIPMRVRFAADAWHSLLDFPGQRRAWQQLLDYELAAIEVVGLDADPEQTALGVRFAPTDGPEPNRPPARRLELS